MQAEKHIINKLYLEVNTSSSKTAYDLKDKFDVFLKEKLLPYLEDYFDSLAKRQPQDTHLQLEKIEIDISAKAPLDLDNLKFRIKKKLEKEVQRAQVLDFSSVISRPEERIQDHFFHFLETGTDPWWNRSGKINVLQDPSEFKTLISSREFALELLEKLQKSSFRSRMIKQLNDSQLKMIIKNSQLGEVSSSPPLKPAMVDKIAAYIEKGVEESGPFTLEQRLLIWDLVLCMVIDQKESETKRKLLRLTQSIIQSFQENFHQPFVERILLKFLLRRKTVKVLDAYESTVLNLKDKIKTTEVKLKKDLAKEGSSKEKNSDKEDSKKEGHAIDDKVLLSPDQETLSAAFDDSEYDQSKMITQSDDNFTFEAPGDHYVENAGLILLHPYLKQLFLNCELLHLNKITHTETAIHLLHYLATREEQQYEHRMIFEKFLCNIPIAHSINRQIELSAALKKHADEMLAAVLHNWTAMKTASTDLLRNEFLQRPGKLILSKDNPKVIIEKKTQDILLDKLPWNLGLCKLPWKNRIIFTDW